ncbi:hypothetical protein ACLB1O_09365 [Escherichia coli]
MLRGEFVFTKEATGVGVAGLPDAGLWRKWCYGRCRKCGAGVSGLKATVNANDGGCIKTTVRIVLPGPQMMKAV